MYQPLRSPFPLIPMMTSSLPSKQQHEKKAVLRFECQGKFQIQFVDVFELLGFYFFCFCFLPEFSRYVKWRNKRNGCTEKNELNEYFIFWMRRRRHYVLFRLLFNMRFKVEFTQFLTLWLENVLTFVLLLSLSLAHSLTLIGYTTRVVFQCMYHSRTQIQSLPNLVICFGCRCSCL